MVLLFFAIHKVTKSDRAKNQLQEQQQHGHGLQTLKRRAFVRDGLLAIQISGSGNGRQASLSPVNAIHLEDVEMNRRGQGRIYIIQSGLF